MRLRKAALARANDLLLLWWQRLRLTPMHRCVLLCLAQASRGLEVTNLERDLRARRVTGSLLPSILMGGFIVGVVSALGRRVWSS